MITTTQAINGLIKYIDTRVVPSIPPAKAILLGGTIIMASRNPQAVEEAILQKAPFLRDIGAYRDGTWDIDAIYESYAPQIRGRFDLTLPFVGNITLDREEADILYKHMKG